MTEEPRENAKILKNRHHDSSDSGESIAQRVYSILDKNPYSTSKHVCRELKISYEVHGHYVRNLICRWKCHHQFGLWPKSPKSPNQHHARAFCYVPKSADRDRALEAGWTLSKNRNRCLLFKDSEFGRIEWFRSGRVNVMIKRPQQMGRVKQLLCKAFYESGLIYDLKVLDAFLARVYWKGAHEVHECSERLPYRVIDNYVESHGIRIVLGDRSHPKAVEVQWCYPDWIERHELKENYTLKALENSSKGIVQNSEAIQQFNELMKDLSSPRKSISSQDRLMVV